MFNVKTSFEGKPMSCLYPKTSFDGVCLVCTPGIFRLVLKVTCLSYLYSIPQAFKTSFEGNPCLVCTLGVQD